MPARNLLSRTSAPSSRNSELLTNFSWHAAALAAHPVRMLSTQQEEVSRELFLAYYRPAFAALSSALPRDVHLLSLRSRNPSSGDVVVRLINEDDRHRATSASQQRAEAPELDVRALFSAHSVRDVRSVSLTLAHDAVSVQHAALPCHSLSTFPSYLDEATRWQLIGSFLLFFVLFLFLFFVMKFELLCLFLVDFG